MIKWKFINKFGYNLDTPPINHCMIIFNLDLDSETVSIFHSYTGNVWMLNWKDKTITKQNKLAVIHDVPEKRYIAFGDFLFNIEAFGFEKYMKELF